MRKRCKRKVWATNIDTVAHAIAGACVTDTWSLNQLRQNELTALETIKAGEGGVQEWRILVDMMNIAEMMGKKGIGPEVLEHCKTGNKAMQEAAKRYETTKKIVLSGEGLKALGDIMEYHDLQRTSIARSEYEKMIRKTANYIKSHGKDVVEIT